MVFFSIDGRLANVGISFYPPAFWTAKMWLFDGLVLSSFSITDTDMPVGRVLHH